MPLSLIDQARADAQILKSGQPIPDADETRLKNATLLSVYGENAAVRHVIEQPERFGGIADAMILAAPTVERVRGAIAGKAEGMDITPDILGAIDELAQGVERGQTLAQAMAHSVAHDISYEGQQMMAFLDENSGNPKKLAWFLVNLAEETEKLGGRPETVRKNTLAEFEAHILGRDSIKFNDRIPRDLNIEWLGNAKSVHREAAQLVNRLNSLIKCMR